MGGAESARRLAMIKVALLVWIILGTVLAGTAMTVIVSTPALDADAMRLIPVACGVAFLVGLPIAYVIARMIADASARPA
jgi:NhaP-type Na+/H+ or K+/H+ antiporter